MNSLMAMELIKLRHRMMPRILLLLLVAIVALLFWALGTRAARVDVFLPRGLLFALSIAVSAYSFLAPVIGGSWGGGEYGWGTIRLVLSRRPNRIAFSTAQYLILVGAIGVGLLFVVATGAVGGAIVAQVTGNNLTDTTGLDAGFIWTAIKTFLAAWYSSSFYVLLAFTAAVVFRSSGAGIGFGIGLNVAETIVRGIFTALGDPWKVIADHLPDAYVSALPGEVAASDVHGRLTGVGPNSPNATIALIGTSVYIAILLIILYYTVTNRDVTA